MTTRSPLQGTPGRPLIAWLVILLVMALMIGSHQLASEEDSVDSQALELLLVRLQSQYIVGVARLTSQTDALLKQVSALNVGPLARRQRYVALLAELAGPGPAELATEEVDKLLAQEAERGEQGYRPREAELAVQQIFRKLFDGFAADRQDETATDEKEAADEVAERSRAVYLARLDGLSPTDRELLSEELGWIAGALLAPEGSTDEQARSEFLAPSLAVMIVIVGIFSLAALAGLAGFAMLVAMAILASKGRVRSGLGSAEGQHALYAETFAVWLALFVVLGLLGGLISDALPALGLWPSLVAFLASLAALRWPVHRGIPWSSVKQDIGLHAGERPWREVLAGCGGYLTALPLLAVGMMITLLLLKLQELFAADLGPFESMPGPAHPIVFQLSDASIWLKLQVLLLASFAAPLVEETMFRGVLYRYLRESSRRHGTLLSVLISGGASSLIFAAIHPQGWLAIPALMALAFSFVLLREWRGSLLPSMLMHGISNGLVMTGLLLLLGTS